MQVPDDVAKLLGGVDRMPRQLLEAFAIQNYCSERLTRHQVSQLLGLDYWETDAFLAQHKAKQPYTVTDLEVDRSCLGKLDEKRGSR